MGKRGKMVQMKMCPTEKYKLIHSELPWYAYKNSQNNKWQIQMIPRILLPF